MITIFSTVKFYFSPRASTIFQLSDNTLLIRKELLILLLYLLCFHYLYMEHYSLEFSRELQQLNGVAKSNRSQYTWPTVLRYPSKLFQSDKWKIRDKKTKLSGNYRSFCDVSVFPVHLTFSLSPCLFPSHSTKSPSYCPFAKVCFTHITLSFLIPSFTAAYCYFCIFSMHCQSSVSLSDRIFCIFFS